jgi:hypothetical protein
MDSSVLIILLLLLLASLSSGTYFISVCGQKGVWALDPTLNKPIYLSNYENCGKACKFSINRRSIDQARRLNTFRRVFGIGLLTLSAILIALLLRLS